MATSPEWYTSSEHEDQSFIIGETEPGLHFGSFEGFGRLQVRGPESNLGFETREDFKA
jgi:hypothetical protein